MTQPMDCPGTVRSHVWLYRSNRSLALPAAPPVTAHELLALCLRLVVAITNYEREDNPGSTIITV